VVVAAVPVHLALAWATDLSPDEAYYLVAAQQPSPVALVDHPPLLPWMLRATSGFTWLPLELRVRLWPVALSCGTALVLVRLAERSGADRPSCTMLAAVLSFALLPMTGGFVATPDGPLLFAFALALLFWSARRPMLVAVALGVASLAKVVALPLGWAVAAAAPVRRLRLAAALGPILVLPLLAPSLAFQLRHAFVEGPAVGWSAFGSLHSLAEAVLVQVALWSPWLLTRGWRGLRQTHEAAVVLVLSALVAASALLRAVPPEANWWAPAAVLLAVAASRTSWTARARFATLAWMLVPAFVAATHAVHPWLPLARVTDPTARLHGWSAGEPPLDAPGVGPYGPAAERCAYRQDCAEILNYFKGLSPHP
jgi:hypothetical protein